MSLTNSDLRQQLRQLAETAQRAEGELARSDDLPALDLAAVAVELDKLGTKAVKLADRIAKLSAPLFANGQDGTDNGQGEKPAARKRK